MINLPDVTETVRKGLTEKTFTAGISDRYYYYQSIYTLFTVSERENGKKVRVKRG